MGHCGALVQWRPQWFIVLLINVCFVRDLYVKLKTGKFPVFVAGNPMWFLVSVICSGLTQT